MAIATFALLLGAAAGKTDRASAYWVCNPTSAVWRAADFRCQHATWRAKIQYIQKVSTPRAYAVYRSERRNGSSISGSEYYSPTADYFLQDFHCAPGYPNAHNRHTVSVYVAYTLAASC